MAKLATEDQAERLQVQIKMLLDISGDEKELPPSFDPEILGVSEAISEWKEGVEQYQGCTCQQLWEMLGLESIQRIPGFQRKIDMDGIWKPWSKEGIEWLATNPAAEDLEVSWHQLVGIVHMVDRILQGKPILLMDEVGVGKTLQAVGLIAILAHFREHFSRHQSFPGKWGECTHPSTVLLLKCLLATTAKTTCRTGVGPGSLEAGNISDDPVMITCPTNLQSQIQAEIERYLEHGKFDVLPYTGKMESRPEFWTKYYTMSNLPPGCRIIVVPHTVSHLTDFLWKGLG